MENVTTVLITLLIVATALSTHLARQWRKQALAYKAFIDNPNVKAVDKEAEYKDTFEAQLNALDTERREINEAMLEVFDYLNDERPFGSHQEGLDQCRNKLMRAIQNSTHGRDPDRMS